jgi:hypothetical protein
MPKTSDELATRALREATLIAADEQPSAADLAFVKETAEAKLAELHTLGVVAFSIDAIPDDAFIGFARVVAGEIGPAFGRDTGTLMVLGMRQLGAVSARPYSGKPSQADYF